MGHFQVRKLLLYQRVTQLKILDRRVPWPHGSCHGHAAVQCLARRMSSEMAQSECSARFTRLARVVLVIEIAIAIRVGVATIVVIAAASAAAAGGGWMGRTISTQPSKPSHHSASGRTNFILPFSQRYGVYVTFTATCCPKNTMVSKKKHLSVEYPNRTC